MADKPKAKAKQSHPWRQHNPNMYKTKDGWKNVPLRNEKAVPYKGRFK